MCLGSHEDSGLAGFKVSLCNQSHQQLDGSGTIIPGGTKDHDRAGGLSHQMISDAAVQAPSPSGHLELSPTAETCVGL